MRLKKLQLNGYKSFAEKTTLIFDLGLTAVVGPNGCGKSNIADAFRWVLGEQSAKSMRGTKMSDVIFAGTSGRAPLNFAEVSITLSDIQGALPIEYEEVTVTRRLHRSGESEYFLNNQPVRLKDLHSLFLDSGIGKDSFSIFEQGKIDQVINYSPLERRYIFEEAAGILRFLQRKRETLRKLEQADNNIVRVKDIHREVELQVEVLCEQAAKAKEFKELKGQIESQEIELLVGKLRLIDKKQTEAFRQEAEMLQALANFSEVVSTLEQRKVAAKRDLEESEKAFKWQGEELFQVRSDKALKMRERSSAQEQLQSSVSKEKRWQHELEALLEQRQHRESELLQQKRQLKAAQTDASSLESILQEQRGQVAAFEVELSKLHQAQKRTQQALLEAHQRDSQIDSELKQNRVRLENSYERQKQLQESKARLSGLEKELHQSYLEKEKLVQELNTSIDRQRELLDALEQKVQAAVEQINALQIERDAISKQLHEHRARLKALLRLRSDFEGFSSASKRLLQESTMRESALYGKLKGLYELILPEHGAQEAVAAALSRYSQTLAVETQADAQAVIDFAQREGLTDFSLVILELLPLVANSSTPHSHLQPLMSQVSASPVATHFLGDILVAEAVEDAEVLVRNHFAGEVWCRDCTFIDHRAVFFYGTQGKSNAFLREAEIKSLESELQITESKSAKIEMSLLGYQQQRALVQAEMAELDKHIRRKEMQQIEATFALQRLGTDIEKHKKDASTIDAESAAVLQGIEKYQAVLEDLQQKHAEALHLTQQNRAQLTALEGDVQHKNATLQELKKALQAADSSCSGAVDSVRRSQQAIQVIEIRENESVRQERRLAEELQHTREFQAQLTAKSQECGLALESIELKLDEVSTAFQHVEEGIQKQKAQIIEVEKEIAAVQQTGKKQESEQHQVALLIAQLEAAYQGLEAELQERYALTIVTAKEAIPVSSLSIDTMEKKLREMRRRSEASGDVNMKAIEEHAKHQVRFEFLNQQIEDLEGSKEGLLQIIGELEGESRKLFKETFAQICTNFKKNFAILFDGGEADLQFTETSDLLEAGIEIIAKPPGKQMRSISLLSGGEKCLTAIALLFAIFEVKAGPFCILDEIDAPLDDSNVERFAKMVKQYVDHCQFIIITHNKQTMAIADRLFGVSMEEKGISKLLQMELSGVA